MGRDSLSMERTRAGIVRGRGSSRAKDARAREMRSHPTAEEELLWERLRRNGLGVHFRRQQIIDGFIVDFYCHSAGLVVEVDGPIHEQQASYDEERDAILAARGLRLFRVSNEQVRANLPSVLAEIKAELSNLSS